MLMDIMERIFDLAARKYPDQKAFAEALGLPPGRISEWKKRKSESYMKRLHHIAEVLGTTPEYLLTGAGPDVLDGFDEETKRFLIRMADTTPAERIAMEAALDAIRTGGK